MSEPKFGDLPKKEDHPPSKDDIAGALLVSIAQEEVALAHIMNAEAEKIQFVVGTLKVGPGGTTKAPLANSITDLIDIDCSVQHTLEVVIAKELALLLKFANVLRFLGLDCPMPSPGSDSGSGMWGP